MTAALARRRAVHKTYQADLSVLPTLLDSKYIYNSMAPNMYTGSDNVQYAVWVAPGATPIIGKRTVPGGSWSTYDLSRITGNPFVVPVDRDDHNSFMVIPDGSGCLHVWGNHHNNAMRYARSTSAGSITAWTTSGAPTGTSVTYPDPIRLPGGDLLLFYREGASGNGSLVMRRYTVATTTWSAPTTIVNAAGTSESVYPWKVVQSASGRIHIFMTWRGTSTPSTNNDFSYMCSDDEGVTWKSSAGAALTLPGTHATVEKIIDTAASGSGMLNAFGSDVDTAGNPHAAIFLYDGNGDTQINHVYWTGSAWVTEFVTAFDFTVDLGSSIVVATLSRPGLVCSADGRTFVIFRANFSTYQDGLWLLDVTPASSGLTRLPGPIQIGGVNLHTAEPIKDLGAAHNRNELSFLLGPAQSADAPDSNYVDISEWRQQFGVVETVDLAQLANLTGPQMGVTQTGAANASGSGSTASGSPASVGFTNVSVPSAASLVLSLAKVSVSAQMSAGTGTLLVEHVNGSMVRPVAKIPVTTTPITKTTAWLPVPPDGEIRVRGTASGGTLSVTAGSITVGNLTGKTTLTRPATTKRSPVLEFDARTLALADGAAVSTWADLSQFARDGTAVGSPTYRATGLLGKPAVEFDGVDDQIRSVVAAIDDQFTVFVVGKRNAATAVVVAADETTTTASRMFQIQAGSTAMSAIAFAGATSFTDSQSGTDFATGAVLSMIRGDNVVQAFMNGASDGSTATTGTESKKAQLVSLGGKYRADTFSACHIGHVLIYPWAMTAAEHEAQVRALGADWGITIP